MVRLLAGEPGVRLRRDDKLHPLGKAAVAHLDIGDIGVVAVQRPQDRHLHPRHGDDAARLDLGAGKLLPLELEGEGVADHAALPRLQPGQHLPFQPVPKDGVPIDLVDPCHLEGLPGAEGQVHLDPHRRPLPVDVVEGKLDGGNRGHLLPPRQGGKLLRGKAG